MRRSTLAGIRTAASRTGIQEELAEIRATLARQQAELDLLRAERAPQPAAAPRSGWRWKVTLLLAAVVLAVGSLGAYQYYRILQSIIDQYPRSGGA